MPSDADQERSPTTQTDPAPVDCHAAASPLVPHGGWAAVAPLAAASDPVQSLSAVAVSTIDGQALLVKIETAPSTHAAAPLLFVDTDGDRLHGVWSYETPVSAAAWDVHIDAEGDVWRHDGLPDEWSWQPVAPPSGFAFQRDEHVTTVCLPASLVGDDLASVRLAVDFDDAWLPATFLGGVSIADRRPSIAIDSAPHVTARARLMIDPIVAAPAITAPSRLAFAYQFRPWLLRGCPADPSDLQCAVEAYRSFRHVVFGGGIEELTHPSHVDTVRLIQLLRDDDPNREIWGYVSMRRHAAQWHGVDEVLRRASLWRDMGVTGIFLDEFDLCEPGWRTCPHDAAGVALVFDREAQNGAVEGIHALDLAVFANAHSVHGALGEVRGVATSLGGATSSRPADMYLLENPTIHAGQWWQRLNRRAGAARFREVVEYSAATSVRIAVVDTAAGPVADDDTSAGYLASWWRALMAGASAHAYTNPVYSASGEGSDNLAVLEPPPGSGQVLGQGLMFAGSVDVTDDGARSTRQIMGPGGTIVGRLVVTIDDDDQVQSAVEFDEAASLAGALAVNRSR